VLRARCRKTLGETAAAQADRQLADKTPPTLAVDHYLRGKAAYDAKQLAEGVKAFEAGLRVEPTHYWSLMWLGYCLCDLGQGPEDYAGAARVFTGCILKRPDHAHPYYCRGNAYKRLGQYDKALAEYHKAIVLDPKFAPAHCGLGSALMAKGLLDEAIEEYHKGIEIDPEYAKYAHCGLGNALAARGLLEEAFAEYRKAIVLDPKFAPAHHGLGSALADKGLLDEAIEECRKVIEIDPEYAKYAHVHSNLGAALADKGLLEEAIAEHRKAIALDPEFAPAHSNLGNALKRKGLLDDGISEYEKAIALDPKFALAHYNLGLSLNAKHRFDEAVAEFHKAIVLAPKLIQAHVDLGVALKAMDRLDDAIAEYKVALRSKKDDPTVHYDLGNALVAKGRLEEAIGEFREAISIKPDYAEAHCNLGNALLQRGEFYQALKALRHGHELGSKNPGWPYPTAQWVRESERLVELDGKLPSILEGKTTPASPAERVELAGLCALKRLNRAAANFYKEALAAEPKLADDLGAAHRYYAACAAALAVCGQGKGAGELSEMERVQLRRQALTWLRADLAAWQKLLEKERDKAASAVRQTVAHWQQDDDLACFRGPGALASLPEAERQEWQKLWNDVEALPRQAVGSRALAAPKKHP
jgi:tetratricopeptide (TPR) repeat protein